MLGLNMNINKGVVVIGVVSLILLAAVVVTLIVLYFTRSESVYIDGSIKDEKYEMRVGDTFYTSANDKPSVGTVQGEPIFDDNVISYLGKEIEDKSNGLMGGDSYVNTYRFEVIGSGESRIEIPTLFRGETSESSVLFYVISK
jgi:hypothetical protein